MMKTIAVTGASGFIGRYLCAAREQEGYQVLRLGRGAAQAADERQTDYSAASLKAALDGADAIVNLAGARMTREAAPADLAPFWGANVEAVHKLVEAARAVGAGRIVQASTIAVYSPQSGLPYREEAPCHPINAYALSKKMAEDYLEMLTRSGGPSAIALRFAATYGHGEKGTPALMKFAGQAIRKEPIILTGNPDYRIDQLYIRDAVSACIAALRSSAQGAFNIGGGTAWPIAEIAGTVNEVFGNQGNLRCETDSTAPMPQTVMALDRARQELGWQPTYDLRSGLEDFREMRLAADR
jgi:UDP-glucose 4-epimerase